jgi:hypothetical protein
MPLEQRIELAAEGVRPADGARYQGSVYPDAKVA